MTKFISDEAIQYMNKIHGDYTMVDRGYRNWNPGVIGWYVAPTDDNDNRHLVICQNKVEVEWDYTNRIHYTNPNYDSNRISLYTIVEDGGDEHFGLVATGHYEDIQKIVEMLKGMNKHV